MAHSLAEWADVQQILGLATTKQDNDRSTIEHVKQVLKVVLETHASNSGNVKVPKMSKI